MSCRVGISEVCEKYIVVQLTLSTVHIKGKYAFDYTIHQLSLLRVPSFEENDHLTEL